MYSVSYSRKKKAKKYGGGWTKTFYLHWRVNGRKFQRATGCKIESVAKQLATKLERELALYGHGLDDPYAKHRTRPLIEHLDDFINYLRNKGNDPDRAYVRDTKQEVMAIITDCQFTCIDDVSFAKVKDWLAAFRRKSNNRAETNSARTCNKYLTALQGFMNFLVNDNRLLRNPIKQIKKEPEDGDRRRVRRTLTAVEFEKLIQATADGPEVQGRSGPDRAMLYLLAVDSGLRRGRELASLTPSSFDFTAEPPTVTVHPRHDKSRRAKPPVPLDRVGPALQVWIASKGFGPNDLLFPMGSERTADMLKVDLAAAGIPYQDAAGRFFDFHSSRSQGATVRIEAGWSLPAVQAWARHSTPTLTSNLYCRPTAEQHAARVAKLPPLPEVRGVAIVATPVATRRGPS